MTTHSSSESSLPTAGQLERTLAQKIQALYREHLAHQPSKVSCQLFGNKVAVILEDSVTKPEQLLIHEGKEELAEQVRQDLDHSLQPELKELVQDVLAVSVLDVLSDSTLETGRAGIILILSEEPKIRLRR